MNNTCMNIKLVGLESSLLDEGYIKLDKLPPIKKLMYPSRTYKVAYLTHKTILRLENVFGISEANTGYLSKYTNRGEYLTLLISKTRPGMNTSFIQVDKNTYGKDWFLFQ